MLLRSTTEYKNGERFPSREGQGPSGPGVGCGIKNEPTPALRDRRRFAPPLRRRGFSRGDRVS